MPATRSKLIRNLKSGDKLRIRCALPGSKPHEAVVTVSTVQETRRYVSGRRCWEVIVDGGYPWWWPSPINGGSTDRIDLA